MSYGSAGPGPTDLVPDAPAEADETESLLGSSGSMRDRVQQGLKFMQSPGQLGGRWKPHQAARLFWTGVTALTVLVGLPLLVLKLAVYETRIKVYLILISIVFCLLAIPISLYSIRRHLLHFWVPPLQIYIVRILWMVPIYSICTLASLCLWVASLEKFVYVADAFRQCYEAYTLYNLFGFMIAFLEVGCCLRIPGPSGLIFAHLL